MPTLANTLFRNRSFSNWYPGDQETFNLRLQTFTMMCTGIWCFWVLVQHKMVNIHQHFRKSCHFPEAPDYKILLLSYIGPSGFIQNNGIFLTHKN